MKQRILITGGSGFIGLNSAIYFQSINWDVVTIDIKAPPIKLNGIKNAVVDINRYNDLCELVTNFQPNVILHLAAKTDLVGKRLQDYNANVDGVRNVVEAARLSKCLDRCIFTSSKLVCKTGYTPINFDDYSPNTIYGESKVLGEKIVKEINPDYAWCICRPTSIWGPWFGVPYYDFFKAISKGRYFHLGTVDPPKSFGYVGNVMAQIHGLLKCPQNSIAKKSFYWSDYSQYTISSWAEEIACQLNAKRIKRLPEGLLQCLAKTGDFLSVLGVKSVPMSSFRLNNMRSDTTGVLLDSMKQIVTDLPYDMKEGVSLTVQWMKQRST